MYPSFKEIVQQQKDGIHYGTKASSKYARKRGSKPTMRNKQKANFSQQVSRYRADKIATSSLSVYYVEPADPDDIKPLTPSQAFVRDGVTGLDYRNLPKHLLTNL